MFSVESSIRPQFVLKLAVDSELGAAGIIRIVGDLSVLK